MNISGQVSYQIWLKLPKQVRDKLVTLFHIPRSGSTVVDYGPQGNVVVSDGYKPTDIEAITLEKMQELMDSDSTNFYELFEDTIMQIDKLLLPTIQIEEKPLSSEHPNPIPKPAFCDQCTSGGGRHLKGCPKR